MSDEEPTMLECTCKVTGPDYEETKFSSKCPFHGKNGTMVALAHAPLSTPTSHEHRITGGLITQRCPHCGRCI